MLTRMLPILILVGSLLVPDLSPRGPTGGATTGAALSQQIHDQYIVVVNAGRDVRAVATAAGVTPTHVYRRVLNGFVATLSAGQRTALERHPDVVVVEPDQLIAATATQAVDPASGLWGLDRIDQRALPLDGSYSYGVTGAGVTAYLIDSGLQANHTNFGTRAQNVYDAFSQCDPVNNPCPVENDCHGHGTHLAGIVGGTTYGVAKQVSVRGVRVLDCQAQGTVGNAIAGIDWVATNAVKPAVATIAFSPVNLDSGNSGTLQLAIENLIASGVFVAVSAGNGSVDACTIAPANVDAAFTVAASTSADSRASFSNYGACVDSYAPGSGITSAWYSDTSNTSTNTLSGTSQATAFVAGAAVLYKARYGDQSQAAINDWLIANATPDVIQGNEATTPNRLLYVNLPPLPTPTNTPIATLTVSMQCSTYQNRGQINIDCEAQASGGLAPYTYRWYQGTTLRKTETTSGTSSYSDSCFSWLGTRTYQVIATDTRGAQASRSTTVTCGSAPTATPRLATPTATPRLATPTATPRLATPTATRTPAPTATRTPTATPEPTLRPDPPCDPICP